MLLETIATIIITLLGQACTLDSPAVLSIYDPALGGINCDDDCTTVASGPFDEGMYKVAGACPMQLYGETIEFGTGLQIECVDTGSMIEPDFSTYYAQCVVYFDVLWPLHREDAPPWTWNLVGWEVTNG